jgi:exodeoxyribonuclease V alpha subunit
VAQEVDERLLVDLEIVVERRDDRREDRPQVTHAAHRIKPVRQLPSDAVQELTVEVTAVRYALEEGDFAVLAGVSDEGEEVVLTGALGHVHAGESVDVTGDWRTHPRHGPQFAVERVRVREPTSEVAVLAYLHSIKHVGIRAAAWLVDRYGVEAVLEEIDRDPERALREAPGIGKQRIRAAVRSWEDQRELRAVRLFLEGHGVPAGAAARIYRALGPGCVEMLRTDPYATTEVEGIGFATADALARALGTPPDAPARIDAGLRHALRQAEDDGHCHLPRAELLERARRLLGADPEDRLDELAASGRLVVEDDRVYDPVMHGIERRLARSVRALIESGPALRRRPGDSFERPASGDFVPTDDQWQAVRNAIEHRLSILTGLPGTGKTQTMRALVELMRAQRRSVQLCAPTGKAARRLGELTGAEASTIHRLLEYVPGEGFARGPDDPIPGLDLLIVDEASMLSVRLADALLGAVGPRTHVLLVGDVDQLAPVGPGRVLEDLIESGVVPTVRLTEIFRQAARSLIVRAAHAINAGQPPPTVAGEEDIRDFFVIERSAPAAIFEDVCDIAVRRLPAAYGLDPAREILVLSPMHKGPLGIEALNAELRRRLNADGAPIAGLPFRVGDRFVQRRNDHEHQLMNGETGVVVAGDDEEERVTLHCDDGRVLRIPYNSCATLELGYCLSIHRAQGSQNRAVVMVLSAAHAVMLTRNLLYTGLTRAQELAVMVGERRALAIGLRRTDAARRHTRLAQLVAG